MGHESAALRESPAADVAHVRLLVGVDELVDPELGGHGERLQANAALVRPFAGVRACVHLQRVIGLEVLAALRA